MFQKQKVLPTYAEVMWFLSLVSAFYLHVHLLFKESPKFAFALIFFVA